YTIELINKNKQEIFEESMLRRKSGIIGSTVSHMINHRAMITIQILMMSLVFLVQLLLSKPIFTDEMLRKKDVEIQNRTFFLSLPDANKEQVDEFLTDLQQYQEIIDEIIITSQIIIPLPAKNTVKTGNGLAGTDTPPSYRLVSFFPSVSRSREISLSRGEYDLESKPRLLFLSDHAFQMLVLMGNTESDLSRESGYTILINQEKWDCTGIGYLSDLPGDIGSANYIITDFSNYQLISKTCDTVYFLFSVVPSETDLAKINQIAYFRLMTNTPLTSSVGESVQSDFFSRTSTLIAIVLVLVLNVLSLFEYLLSLRYTEFRIYLLTGATWNSIWILSMVELTISVSLSVLIGGLISVLPIAQNIFGFQVWNMSPTFFFENAFAYLAITWVGFSLRWVFGKYRRSFMYIGGGAR
ncbi:MAG: hypothetical protein WC251_03785, partial [Candidatus Izemoplasmatales bacterium]